MLARGPQCTTRRGRYPIVPQRRHGVLVHERVLARDMGTERSMFIISFPISIPCYICISSTYRGLYVSTSYNSRGNNRRG